MNVDLGDWVILNISPWSQLDDTANERLTSIFRQAGEPLEHVLKAIMTPVVAPQRHLCTSVAVDTAEEQHVQGQPAEAATFRLITMDGDAATQASPSRIKCTKKEYVITIII